MDSREIVRVKCFSCVLSLNITCTCAADSIVHFNFVNLLFKHLASGSGGAVYVLNGVFVVGSNVTMFFKDNKPYFDGVTLYLSSGMLIECHQRNSVTVTVARIL